ncbi:hypothetical protein [Thalassoroseus pseudoceratinae]|uniref:hypothetical protein n=1 Tax=Thalassoroseus pseudoceratinae TaxID=2713176 RepID=UPI0014214A26|nr:hypothetical protein [Thalassoroseus pseudoceratinae]
MLFGSLIPTVSFIGSLLTAGPTALPNVSASPLRVVELASGEQISAEVLGSDERTLSLRLRGGSVVQVPREFVSTISQQPGWRDVFFEDFENASKLRTVDDQPLPLKSIDSGSSSTAWVANDQTTRWDFRSTKALTAGRFCWTTRPVSTGSNSGEVSLSFQDGNVVRRLNLRFDQAGQSTVTTENLRVATYSVSRSVKPTRWTVIFGEHGVRLLANDVVVANGKTSGGSLAAIEMELDANASVGFDDLLLQSRWPTDTDQSDSPVSDNAQASITQFDGSRLYGEILHVGKRSIRWKFGEQHVVTPWTDVRAVGWNGRSVEQEHKSYAEAKVTGKWGRVRFRPWQLAPATAPVDELEVAIRANKKGVYSVAHPILGQFSCPTQQVATVEPLFDGTRQVLLNHRIPFVGPRTRWAEKFRIARVEPAAKQFVRLTTSGLEPSGPNTFLGSRYLRELRNGSMTTQLWVNDQRVAVLNEFLSRHHSETEIRVPIPHGMVQSGENSWEIRQIPRSPNGADFDRCVIGPVYWESEPAEVAPSQ